jgi:hypothetical protein
VELYARNHGCASGGQVGAGGGCTAILPPLRQGPHDPSVLFKTIVYWTVVFLVRFLEKLVEYWFCGGTLSGILEYVAAHFTWHRFGAIQIWIFVLFLIYTSVAELNARLDKGAIVKIFFTRRPSELKQTHLTPSHRANADQQRTQII